MSDMKLHWTGFIVISNSQKFSKYNGNYKLTDLRNIINDKENKPKATTLLITFQ